MKIAYGIYYSADSTEGRLPDSLHEICVTEELALKLAKGKGPMGGSDGTVKKVYLLEHEDDVKCAHRAEEIDRALKKLTPRERSLLNLE